MENKDHKVHPVNVEEWFVVVCIFNESHTTPSKSIFQY